jgi:hypothetical protein
VPPERRIILGLLVKSRPVFVLDARGAPGSFAIAGGEGDACAG